MGHLSANESGLANKLFFSVLFLWNSTVLLIMTLRFTHMSCGCEWFGVTMRWISCLTFELCFHPCILLCPIQSCYRWSLSQVPWVQRKGMPWICSQSITVIHRGTDNHAHSENPCRLRNTCHLPREWPHLRFGPQTMLLWGNSAKHCNMMPPWTQYSWIKRISYEITHGHMFMLIWTYESHLLVFVVDYLVLVSQSCSSFITHSQWQEVKRIHFMTDINRDF